MAFSSLVSMTPEMPEIVRGLMSDLGMSKTHVILLLKVHVFLIPSPLLQQVLGKHLFLIAFQMSNILEHAHGIS